MRVGGEKFFSVKKTSVFIIIMINMCITRQWWEWWRSMCLSKFNSETSTLTPTVDSGASFEQYIWVCVFVCGCDWKVQGVKWCNSKYMIIVKNRILWNKQNDICIRACLYRNNKSFVFFFGFFLFGSCLIFKFELNFFQKS